MAKQIYYEDSFYRLDLYHSFSSFGRHSPVYNLYDKDNYKFVETAKALGTFTSFEEWIVEVKQDLLNRYGWRIDNNISVSVKNYCSRMGN